MTENIKLNNMLSHYTTMRYHKVINMKRTQELAKDSHKLRKCSRSIRITDGKQPKNKRATTQQQLRRNQQEVLRSKSKNWTQQKRRN